VYGLQARRLTSLFHCRRTNRLRGAYHRKNRLKFLRKENLIPSEKRTQPL
jgi:hypothetical protein